MNRIPSRASVARLALLVVVCVLASCRRPARRPSIILISIDTLRSDRVSAYGYRAATTANIDRLAHDSLRFTNAWSHCPLTLPSHLSIFTGLLPPEHGVRDNVGYSFDADRHPTIATRLRNAGYHTAGAVSAWVLRGATGASAGFDEWDDAIGLIDRAPVGALQRSGEVAERSAERWIDKNAATPFFYFLHLYEPHSPYQPTYDADIGRADVIVGQLIDFLKRRQLYDDSMIVLLSDHGEGLSEHGESEHGVFVYREDLQIPLIVKMPGNVQSGISDRLAGLIDVAPTIAKAAGLPPIPGRGYSLLDAGGAKSVYGESVYGRVHFGWHELRSVVADHGQLIDAPRPELFDLVADPRERSNRLALDRRRFNTMSSQLAQTVSTFVAPTAVAPEEAKKLAALGYVGGGVEEGGDLPDPKDRIADVQSLREIDVLERRGDLDSAILGARELLARNPLWSDLRESLGGMLERRGSLTDAVSVYEEGIRRSPRLAGDYARSAANALLVSGDLSGAKRYGELAVSAGAPGAHLVLGEVALASRDFALAAREADAAGRASESHGHALFLKARIAAATGDLPGAARLFDQSREEGRRAGESEPQHYHEAHAEVLVALHRIPAAEAELRNELHADPQNVRAWTTLGRIQSLSGDVTGARSIMDEMIAAIPTARAVETAAANLDQWGDHDGARLLREAKR